MYIVVAADNRMVLLWRAREEGRCVRTLFKAFFHAARIIVRSLPQRTRAKKSELT